MDRFVFIASSGASQLLEQQAIAAHNLANASTAGYKAETTAFRVAPVVGPGLPTRAYALDTTTGADLSPGVLQPTGRDLDIAIEGEGFFQIKMPDGQTAYSRDGSFQISDQGVLVTSGGQTLEPQIRVPEDASELTISNTGIVTVRRGNDIQPTEIGRIELANFANPSGLYSLGQNLYAPTAASGQPVVGVPAEDGMGRLQQGSLEGSNVEIVTEMVEMISAMRAYEIASKAVKTADEMGQIANNITR